MHGQVAEVLAPPAGGLPIPEVRRRPVPRRPRSRARGRRHDPPPPGPWAEPDPGRRRSEPGGIAGSLV